MEVTVTTAKSLHDRWTELDGKKGTVINRCEQYADWTLPYIFPRLGANSMELSVSRDSIGARGTNHLANRVVMTLFPSQNVFFRLELDSEAKKLITKAIAQGNGGDPDATSQQLAEVTNQLEKQLAEVEKEANSHMDMVQYRPVAVMAAKHLIVTGNALMIHPEKQPAVCFGLRNYCIVRDISGQPVEMMTKETKAYNTFTPAIQDMLRNAKFKNKNYLDDSDVTIYSQVILEEDGKWHMYQAADEIVLNTDGAVWPKKKLPWIPLVWNLVAGEDYGRGLVEEYAGAFHALQVMTGSLLNIAAVMGDIKFLVNPASVVNVPDLNASPSGSYHSGKPDDVAAIQTNKLNDAQFISTMIERYTKQLSEAFLLMSTRDAERVTREEIRQNAQELETSNGGIYSRLASTWQAPTAYIVLDQMNFIELDDGIVPRVVTGMDSLSRQSELDNYREFLADLAMLEQIPEDVRGRLKLSDYIGLVARARQIDADKIIMSEAAYQQIVAQRMEEQKQMMAQEQQGKVAVAGATQAMKEQ